MQFNETQLSKLIESVEKEFNAHLAKAEEGETSLSKSEDGDKKPMPPKKEDESKEHEEKPETEHSEHEEKPQHEAAAPTPEAPAEAAVGSHDYDEEDLSHLHKMYQSMSEGERKVHHDAIMKCAAMPMGKSEPKDDKEPLSPKPHDKGDNMFPDKQNGGIEGAEPHNALGAKSPASDANGKKINKSESDRRNGGKIEAQAPANTPGAKSPASKEQGVEMQKSEQGTEVELLKSELGTVNGKYEELKKNFEAVSAFLTKLVEKKAAPAAKAITSLEVIAKGENHSEEKPLTKSEVGNVLLKKSQDPSTSKADRDAINNFYLSGGSIESISHLLK